MDAISLVHRLTQTSYCLAASTQPRSLSQLIASISQAVVEWIDDSPIISDEDFPPVDPLLESIRFDGSQARKMQQK